METKRLSEIWKRFFGCLPANTTFYYTLIQLSTSLLTLSTRSESMRDEHKQFQLLNTKETQCLCIMKRVPVDTYASTHAVSMRCVDEAHHEVDMEQKGDRTQFFKTTKKLYTCVHTDIQAHYLLADHIFSQAKTSMTHIFFVSHAKSVLDFFLCFKTTNKEEYRKVCAHETVVKYANVDRILESCYTV